MAYWYVYILRCADGSLYTGATNDVHARIERHNAGKGARYTRARLPVSLVWKQRVRDKSAALSLEYAIKQLSRAEKIDKLQRTSHAKERTMAKGQQKKATTNKPKLSTKEKQEKKKAKKESKA
jgi:putative endonuclease